MHIAFLEDDASQAQLIQSILLEAGHQSTAFSTGRSMMAALTREPVFDMLILDWELPDISGLDVLRWVRANLGHALPVMFVTSRIDEGDLIIGLHAGADDYLAKPIRPGEFIARVSALLRRVSTGRPDGASFTFAVYQIDPVQAIISLASRPIELAPKEYELALLFFRNPGRLFSRDVLSSTVWNREIPATSRTLDTHLSNIRRKLELRPENGVRLVSSYALGYRLELLAEPTEPLLS
ncbi:response regulator [Pusillimonas sp. TS35]|uniref:response regulator transcription factor n=1 Tax=Paracandidimonas lactea TaxID=2895524 RepID=UPI00136BB9BA|nr:response regulator transcription factor [Paracandidimonas lactea]MYN12634.1 response regulator [Pusillimonas sp. TS35]